MNKKNRIIKVLLVEDDELAQISTKCHLDKLNCTLDVAETGEEALKLTQRNIYDLILMDLGILDMDGFTITENIRQLPNDNSKAPIIVLTAHIDKSFEKRAQEVGCDEYIVKPMELEQLQHLINKFVITKRH